MSRPATGKSRSKDRLHLRLKPKPRESLEWLAFIRGIGLSQTIELLIVGEASREMARRRLEALPGTEFKEDMWAHSDGSEHSSDGPTLCLCCEKLRTESKT